MRDAVFNVYIRYRCKTMLCIKPLQIFLRADSYRTPGPTLVYEIQSDMEKLMPDSFATCLRFYHKSPDPHLRKTEAGR
jgi:hypothetical protein